MSVWLVVGWRPWPGGSGATCRAGALNSCLRELGVRRPRRCLHLLGERPGGNGGTIGRANLDGSGVNQSFITGAGGPGVAVDGAPRLLDQRSAGHDRAGQPRRQRRQPELHHRRQRPDRGGGRRRPHLLGQHAAPNTIGRANLDGTGVNQSFITGASSPHGVAVDGGHVYWANAPTRHDRAGQPRRHRRQPELHHRRQRPERGRGRRRAHLLDQLRRAARSGGPTSTAPASTRASSPAPAARPGWRSTAPTSTGPAGRTDLAARSGGPTSTAPASTRTSSRSPAPASPMGWRSTRCSAGRSRTFVQGVSRRRRIEGRATRMAWWSRAYAR